MIDLIEQEIAVLRALIIRHQGVGCYADNCLVWGYYLEAYEKMLDLAKRTIDFRENNPKESASA